MNKSLNPNVILWVIILVFNIATAMGQSNKLSFSNGVKYKNGHDYEKAILNFNQVLKENNSNYDAFIERAYCYFNLDSLKNASEDFYSAMKIKPKHYEGILGLVKVEIKRNRFVETEKLIEKYLQSGIDNAELLLELGNCKFNIGKFEETIKVCNDYLKMKENSFDGLLLKAYCYDSLKQQQTAVACYIKALAVLDASSSNLQYKIQTTTINNSISNCYLNLGLYDVAEKYNTKVLLINDNDKLGLICNFKINVALKNQTKAMKSIDKLIVLEPLNYNFKNLKGVQVMQSKQFVEAIECFTQSIEIKDNYPARINRAFCFDSKLDFNNEIKDLELAKSMTNKKVFIDSLINSAEKRKYDFFRETEPPKIAILNNEIDSNHVIELTEFDEQYEIAVAIKDKSLIDQVVINDKQIKFEKDSLNPSLFFKIKPALDTDFVIEASDIYFNKAHLSFHFKKGENNPPLLNLNSDLPIDEDELFIEGPNDSIVKIKFHIEDETNISELVIDNIQNSNVLGHKSFETEEILNLRGREKFSIYVKDKLGNDSLYLFKINRSNQNLGLMGRTWVVFIENTNYENLTKLEGPKNDIQLIEKALINYQVHKTIVKNNLSKLELEKFMSIELRDKIKKGRVESLLIWYAGHGTNLNDVGYWIPVDAKPDDEFTFYSISSLKSSLMNYTSLKHLLVISDACETGLAFCRPETQNTNPNCDDWEAISSKSAQVLTSSNIEKSSDNSNFAKVIANSLINSTNQCLSINKIAERVLNIVSNTSQQSPRFGRIKNVDDENGTYFFIKKPE